MLRAAITLIALFLPYLAWAQIDIVALLPNPIGDDTLGEYIEIRNTGCHAVDLSGYRLYDASSKTHSIASGTYLLSHTSLSLPYNLTKISLNNSGDESITLTDMSGMILDTESYSGTQRDGVIISPLTRDDDCIVQDQTGSTIGSGTVTHTGSTSTGTLDTQTGSTATGTLSGSGTSTGTNTQPTPIIFPDIIPTRQEPTNALLSGSIWDCGTNQPCRINITFEPIFTGGLRDRDYLCEVITETGTITTCNPNTLYFSTGGVFGLRLTSKIDLTQSREMTWYVVFATTTIPDMGTNSGVTQTGSTDTGSISPVIFPDIIPTYQQYTNTTHSGDVLTCVTSPCRVNFTLESIFTGSFLSRDYTCQILYGTGVYDSCNPPQLYPSGTGSIEIILIHRLSGQRATHTLEIIDATPVLTPTSPSQITPPIGSPDTTPPIAIIDWDGKNMSYYEQINDYEYNCYTHTCSINLTGERSYDPGGGSIRYLWIYGPNEIKTSRDPGVQKYSIGDHLIILRVIDMAGNYSEIRYIIHVLGPRPELPGVVTSKKSKHTSLDSLSETNKKKKSKKKLKMVFFDPPEIVLQSPKYILSNGVYRCRTTTQTCSINWQLKHTHRGISYIWKYDDGDEIVSRNPPSRRLTLGSHQIYITARYTGSDDIIWQDTLRASVTHITKSKKISKKSKKIKKPKKPKTQKTKISPKQQQRSTEGYETIPHRSSTETDAIPYTTFALLIGIIPLIILRRYTSHQE